jgi:hypothetical protein
MDYELPEIKGREFSNRVLKFLNNIKRGQETDKWGWIDTV